MREVLTWRELESSTGLSRRKKTPARGRRRSRAGQTFMPAYGQPEEREGRAKILECTFAKSSKATVLIS